MEHKQTILLAPALSNSSCWRRDTSEATWTGPGPGELLRATLILVLSLGILCANLLVICVINSRRYSKYIHAQVGKLNKYKRQLKVCIIYNYIKRSIDLQLQDLLKIHEQVIFKTISLLFLLSISKNHLMRIILYLELNNFYSSFHSIETYIYIYISMNPSI